MASQTIASARGLAQSPAASTSASAGRRAVLGVQGVGNVLGLSRRNVSGPAGLARSNVACSAGISSISNMTPVTAKDPVMSPMISTGADQGMDLMGYLLQNRVIFIGGPINDSVACSVVAALMCLDEEDPEEDITIYINSPGGQIYSVLGIIDMMNAIRPDVRTICFGITSQQSTLILAGGAKGKRYAMSNSRIMIGQPMSGAQGSADECNIAATEASRSMKLMQRMYAEWGGQSIEKMEEETDRDTFMGPQEAIDLGLIDAIV